MDRERKKRFAVLLNWLAEKYPLDKAPRVLSTTDMADYYAVLADIRIERLEWGAKWIFGHCRFFPKPAELRDAAERAPATVIPQLPKPRTQIGEVILPEERQRQEAEGQEKVKEILRGLHEKFGPSARS